MELQTSDSDTNKNKAENNETPLHNCVDIITIIPDANFLPLNGEEECENSLDSSYEYFCCKHCDFQDSNKQTVLVHLNSHASRQTNRCRLCGFTAPYHKTVLKHVELCHRGNGNDVQRGIKFMQNNNILQLIGVRLKKGLPVNYSHIVNESKSPFEEVVAAQVKSRHSEGRMRKVRCKLCSYVSKSAVDMSYHKHFHKSNSGAPFHCNYCSFWAVEKLALDAHLLLHNKQQLDSKKDVHELNSSKGNSGDSKNTFLQRVPSKHDQIIDDEVEEYSYKTELNDSCEDNVSQIRITEKGLNMDSQSTNSSAVVRSRMAKQNLLQKDESFNNKNYEVESSGPLLPKGNPFSIFYCEKCPASFTEESSLQDHNCYHGAALTYSCPFCDYRAGYAIYLKHLEVHMSEYISDIAQINKEENSKEWLKKDLKLLSNDWGIFNVSYWEHKETLLCANKNGCFADKIKKYHCTQCPAAFSRKRIHSYHHSLHGSNGKYSCSKCSYTTNNIANNASHMSLHHCVEESCYACPKCPLIFYHEAKFLLHLSFHGKNSSFPCNICDYSSSSRSKVMNHKTLHKNLLGLQDTASSLYDLMESALIKRSKEKCGGHEFNKAGGKLSHKQASEMSGDISEPPDEICENYMKEEDDGTPENYLPVPMEDALEVVIKEEPVDETFDQSYEPPVWESYESILPD